MFKFSGIFYWNKINHHIVLLRNWYFPIKCIWHKKAFFSVFVRIFVFNETKGNTEIHTLLIQTRWFSRLFRTLKTICVKPVKLRMLMHTSSVATKGKFYDWCWQYHLLSQNLWYIMFSFSITHLKCGWVCIFIRHENRYWKARRHWIEWSSHSFDWRSP